MINQDTGNYKNEIMHLNDSYPRYYPKQQYTFFENYKIFNF